MLPNYQVLNLWLIDSAYDLPRIPKKWYFGRILEGNWVNYWGKI